MTYMSDLLIICISSGAGLSIGIAMMILKQSAEKQAFHHQFSDLQASIAVLTTERDHERSHREDIQQQLRDTDIKMHEAERRLVQTRTEHASAQQRLEEQKQDIVTLQKDAETRFENIANRLFTEKSADFKKMSAENLSSMLDPFAKDITLFREKMERAFGEHTKEQYALKSEIERIVHINEKMTLQAEGLANALKGDSKKRGNWGEMLLERVLEASELRKDEDYKLQAAGMGLKDESTGKTLQPDAVIFLPDSKHLIVDAKVSLVPFEQYVNATDQEARDVAQAAFLRSVRRHVDDLAGKKYHYNEKLTSPDFVFMFMPSEGAYSLAVQTDMQLQSYAWNKGVVLSSPCTLFAMLRTAGSLWTMERQRLNATEIAVEAGKLYDKIYGFHTDMQALGKQLDKAQDTFGSAMNKLQTGKGNIIGKTEQLRLLGAQAKKRLDIMDNSA